MDRPRGPRQRPAQASEARRRETRPVWATTSLLAGAAALGICTMAGLLMYRYFTSGKTPKKARSKHSKKERKSKKQEVVEEEPELRKSGAASPRGPSRPASPVAAPKSVPDSSRQDQFAWWKEIATDQFEARKTDHAQYYAKKALDLAASIPFVQETTSYQQLRFIMVAGINEPEARTQELQSIREALNRISSTEGGMKEYHLLKGRVLATLSDAMVRRQSWAAAEEICEETIQAMQKGFEGQDTMLFTNLAIQYYQLAGVQRGLKKFKEAAESAKTSYEYVVKSKLQPEFWSQVARQRADILDALNLFDEAKAVMVDHLERIEAHHESLSATFAQKLAKQKVRAEKLVSGEMPTEEDLLDDEDDEDDLDEDTATQSQQTVNQKHLTNVADNCMFLGRLHFERGFFNDAIAYLEKAHSMASNYHYLSMLACAQFEAGLAADAVITQNKIKELRSVGEMPISTSRAMLTKVHFLRQAKRDGPWVFSIEVENKKQSPLSEVHRLPAGTYIEAFVRRHYSPDEVIPAGTKKHSLGPYTYVVTNEEKDSILKINGLLSEKLEHGKVYEIVLFAYPSAVEKSNRIAAHRQLVRSADINHVFRSSMLSGAPFTQEQLEEDLDDYALPDTDAAVESTEEGEDVSEEINADAAASSSAPAEQSTSATEASSEEKVEEIVAEEKTEEVKVEEPAAPAPVAVEAVEEKQAEEKVEEVKVEEPIVAAPVVEAVEAVVEKIEEIVEEVVAAPAVVEESAPAVEAVVVEEVIAVVEEPAVTEAEKSEETPIVAVVEEVVAVVVPEVVAEEKQEEAQVEATEDAAEVSAEAN